MYVVWFVFFLVEIISRLTRQLKNEDNEIWIKTYLPYIRELYNLWTCEMNDPFVF